MGQKDIAVSNNPVMDREHTHVGIIRPPVDIFENDDGITIKADLPGVTKEALNIGIDQSLLTIEAKAKSNLTGEQVLREFLPGNYYRQFQVPDGIDTEKISADMNNGVLTLNLPKAESAKPRRIEIT
jgi:HSP20 family molecular chaperone IbpA